MKKREPAVEGRFYPSTQSKIFAQIHDIDRKARYDPVDIEISQILGAVLPHAGHIYSGHQTVPFFRLLNQSGTYPDTFVIIHPNHSGRGAPIAIDDSDIWVNAAGEVRTNREFANAMGLPLDHMAHAGEHSAEVIIPFIQYYMPEHPYTIVAVCMQDQRYESAMRVSESIDKAIKETGRDIMVLSSCDFSHFTPPGLGEELDQYALDEILSKNTSGVERAVREHRLSICGYGPIMALMEYARKRDRNYKVKILARGHSGEVIPSPEVVDYISMILYR